MARRISTKKVTKTLKKEVNLPVRLPDNKVGKVLSKKRRILGSKYITDSFAEIKKVVWPTRRVSLKLTLSVILFTIVLTIIISLADLGIGNVVERILL